MPHDPKNMTKEEKLEVAKKWFQSFVENAKKEYGIDLTNPLGAGCVIRIADLTHVDEKNNPIGPVGMAQSLYNKAIDNKTMFDPAEVKGFLDECKKCDHMALMPTSENGDYQVNQAVNQDPAEWITGNIKYAADNHISEDDILNLYQLALNKKLYLMTKDLVFGAENWNKVPYVLVGRDNSCVLDAIENEKKTYANYKEQLQKYDINSEEEYNEICNHHAQVVNVNSQISQVMGNIEGQILQLNDTIQNAQTQAAKDDAAKKKAEFEQLKGEIPDAALQKLLISYCQIPSLYQNPDFTKKYGHIVKLITASAKAGSQDMSPEDMEKIQDSLLNTDNITTLYTLMHTTGMTDSDLLTNSVQDRNGKEYDKSEPEKFFLTLCQDLFHKQIIKVGNDYYQFGVGGVMDKSYKIENGKYYTNMMNTALQSVTAVSKTLFGPEGETARQRYDLSPDTNTDLIKTVADTLLDVNNEMFAQKEQLTKGGEFTTELLRPRKTLAGRLKWYHNNLGEYFKNPDSKGKLRPLNKVKLDILKGPVAYLQNMEFLQDSISDPCQAGTKASFILASKILENYVAQLDENAPFGMDQTTTNRKVLYDILFNDKFRTSLLETIAQSSYVQDEVKKYDSEKIEKIATGEMKFTPDITIANQAVQNILLDEERFLKQLNITKEELLKIYSKDNPQTIIPSLIGLVKQGQPITIKGTTYKYVEGVMRPEQAINGKEYKEWIDSLVNPTSSYFTFQTIDAYFLRDDEYNLPQSFFERYNALLNTALEMKNCPEGSLKSSNDFLKVFTPFKNQFDSYIASMGEYFTTKGADGKYPKCLGDSTPYDLLKCILVYDQCMEDLTNNETVPASTNGPRILAVKLLEHYADRLVSHPKEPFMDMGNPDASQLIFNLILFKPDFRKRLIDNIAKTPFVQTLMQGKTGEDIVKIARVGVQSVSLDYAIIGITPNEAQDQWKQNQPQVKADDENKTEINGGKQRKNQTEAISTQIHRRYVPTVMDAILETLHTAPNISVDFLNTIYATPAPDDFTILHEASLFNGEKNAEDGSYTLNADDKQEFLKEVETFSDGLDERTHIGASSDNYRRMHSAVWRLKDYVKLNQDNLDLNTLSIKLQTAVTYTESYLSGKGVDPAKYPDSLKGHVYKNDYEKKRITYAGTILKALRQRQSSLSDLMQGKDPRLNSAWDVRQAEVKERRNFMKDAFGIDTVSLKKYEHSEDLATTAAQRLYGISHGNDPLNEDEKTHIKECISQMCVPKLHKLLVKQLDNYKPLAATQIAKFLDKTKTLHDFTEHLSREELKDFIEHNGEEKLIKSLAHELGNINRIPINVQTDVDEIQAKKGPDNGPVGPQ